MQNDTYCIFEPSEIKQLALHATDLYFANMNQELKEALLKEPIKYTTLYAKIYADTIREIKSSKEFQESKYRR